MKAQESSDEMFDLTLIIMLQKQLCLIYSENVNPDKKLTHETFGLDSELFTLFCPSLFLAGKATDETGCCLHLTSAALCIF